MKRKIIWFLVLIFIILAIFIFRTPILEGAARFLVVEDKIEPVDLIIVLAGDNNGERVIEAIDLYNRGYAKKLLMSGGPLAWNLTNAEWMKKQARAMGIPSSAILLEDRSLSTIDNARFSLPIVKDNNFKSIIVITSPTHTRRTRKVFRKVFPNVIIHGVPLKKSQFKLPGWWQRHEDTQRVIWEYVSLIYYFLKGY